MDKHEWIAFGIEQGYCQEPVCETHQGVILTEEEADFEDGGDPCITVARLIAFE